MRRLLVLGVVVSLGLWATSSAAGRVLLVGSYHGIKGQYTSIESAVRAAHANDWILVGPGDYKTTTSETVSGAGTHFPAAILITKPGVYLRGMNRNTVIVDGTKSGPPCSDRRADQNFGPSTVTGRAGLNGIMVWKANNVWIQNLTACNFIGGPGGGGSTGNEIWWNGGANSGRIGGRGFRGSYLNATTTWFDPNTSKSQSQREATAAAYGIFSSNWSGGTWYRTYASNFNDSGYYIGACQQVCNQVVNRAWGEWNALGYSGSNSGGKLIVENSQFDHNEDGFDTNSQNGDNPPPQNGACPHHGTSPITHTHSCWVFIHNYVHDNNDPNVPTAGAAAAGPVGTGLSIAGGRNDTIIGNRFVHNDAWGVIFVPYPSFGTPCSGATGDGACLFDEYGNALLHNTFAHNGRYGNPTNGDFAASSSRPDPTDCFHGNKDIAGALTSSPSNAEHAYPVCNGKTVPPNTNPMFTNQVLCDSQFVPGTPCVGGSYPRATKVKDGLHPLPPPRELPTMPNPCRGVPANPWCPRTSRIG